MYSTFIYIYILHPYKHSTSIPRWNDVETVVSTSFQRGIHVKCLLGCICICTILKNWNRLFYQIEIKPIQDELKKRWILWHGVITHLQCVATSENAIILCCDICFPANTIIQENIYLNRDVIDIMPCKNHKNQI